MYAQCSRLYQARSAATLPHAESGAVNSTWHRMATRVQAKPAPEDKKAAHEHPATRSQESDVHKALAESHPLPADVRAEFEPRLHADLSHVRISTGPAAARAAHALHARAFTVGHTIIFGAGAYAPHTAEGRRLLAHELAHVLQQTGEAAHSPAGRPHHPTPVHGAKPKHPTG